MKKSITLCLLFATLTAHAGSLELTINNGPVDGILIFQIYSDADLFGELRKPQFEARREVNASNRYTISDVPEGTVALVVYHDNNNNGQLDRNFIGIPKELLAISNNYRPKGPPSFERARFELAGNQAMTLDMYQILGRRGGRWGVGIGAVAQSSPYLDSTDNPSQVFPAIAYIGERLQWFGPALQYSLVGSGAVRLALTANYRIGTYDEDDSDALAGLGDRDGTLLAGLSVRIDLPKGLLLNVGYQHDVLDQIGGGEGNVTLSRGFQFGKVRLSPQLAWNWTSSELSQHDFGVPIEAANAQRPAFRLGSTANLALGINANVELTEAWRLNLALNAEDLDSDIGNSPIVDEDQLFSGFFTLTYTF